MSEAKDLATYYLVKLHPIKPPPKSKRRLNPQLYAMPYYLSVDSDFWWRLTSREMDAFDAKTRYGILAAHIQYVCKREKATRFATQEDASGCIDIYSQRLRLDPDDHRTIQFDSIEVIRFDPQVVSKVQL